jgi:hypothetical protein
MDKKALWIAILGAGVGWLLLWNLWLTAELLAVGAKAREGHAMAFDAYDEARKANSRVGELEVR